MPDTQTNGSAVKKIAIGTKDKKMEFEVPIRYQAGDTINAEEARSLNQTMRENIGNNFRQRVQAFLLEGKGTEAEIREAFDAYANSYEFSAASAGTGKSTMTPLERESRKIATAIVKSLLAKPSPEHPNGRKVATKKVPEGDHVVSAEAFESEVARFADTEKVQKLAAKNLKDTERLVNEAFETAGA